MIMANKDVSGSGQMIREGRIPNKSSHDELIDSAKRSGNYGDRTDAYSQGVGYLGVDDLDKMRRRKIR